MRVTGWIIGCTECEHAAIARMPLAEARRQAYRHGWQRRRHGSRPCWICPYCAGYRLPTQGRLPRHRVVA